MRRRSERAVVSVVKGARSIGGEVPVDAPADPRRGGPDRIPRQMRVARGRPHLRAIQQLPDRREACAVRKLSFQAALRGLTVFLSTTGGGPGFRVSRPVRRGRDARPEWP